MSNDDWEALMRAGLFEDAWRLSDWCLRHDRRPQSLDVPRHLQTIWDGTPLEGRRVFIRCYHGLGDTLQFLRYVPLVQQLARETIVWIQPPLIELVQPALPGVLLLPLDEGAAPIAFDVEVEVMELAHVFRSTPDTLPPPLFRHARHRQVGDRPRVVGLRWSAGDWDQRRGLTFDAIEPLLEVPGIQFVALEEQLSADEQRWFAAEPTRGLTLLARAIEACDLIIAVDGMPAHLAGALGVRTWTLLKHHADWRWLSNRVDSPWYPSMRLYRQPEPDEWAPLITHVRADLVREGLRLLPRTRPRVDQNTCSRTTPQVPDSPKSESH